MIQLFVEQHKIKKSSLKYSAGVVCEADEEYIVGYAQKGAEDTFSISQPVYDIDKNLLGYLGIGMYSWLDYTHNPHGEDIPCHYWKICNPTKYCKDGIRVFTYWQNYNEYQKVVQKNEEH